jgi:para-nitrobenzyl esterase
VIGGIFKRHKLRHTHRPVRALSTLALLALAACGSGDDDVTPTVLTGTFVDSPVSGLNYVGSETPAGTTNASGQFNHRAGERISFSIGNLPLGSATAGATGGTVITPLSVTEGAASATDQRVNNKLILLQTIDADGDLNNGIQITEAIRAAVSDRAASINFDQPTAAFRTSLTPLLNALNTANVFSDLDPRARTARTAAAALEHFARSTSPRHVVATTLGQLSGYEATATTWQFLGIPYAQPPVGNLRWRPPQALQPWAGMRDAIAWANQAAQDPRLESFGEGGMSEDCLYLNVTTPKSAPTTGTGLPVMVWFHGGGFTSLTSNTKPFNNPNSLVTQDVVQVSVNHRLGPFGYIAHPALSAEAQAESGYNGSGNYGQMDLIAALQWVQANIARFGGDPNNVTIFGESGGGRKVLSLMASPQARGLFHKAISQSGTLIPDTRSLASAEAIGTQLQTRLAATSLADMRNKTWLEVVTAAAPLVPYTNVDNRYLPTTERVSFETRQHNDVPFLIVVNANDTIDPITTVKNVFPWMKTYSNAPHYAAHFTHMPAGWRARGVTTYHGGELTYVFNYPESVISHYALNLVIDPATNARLVIGDLNGNGTAADPADIMLSAGFDALDTTVSTNTMRMWTNFAKTGNPSVTGLIEWPAYTTANDAYVQLGATPVARTGLSTLFP